MMPMPRNDSPGPRPRARREGLVCPSPSLEDLRKALREKAMLPINGIGQFLASDEVDEAQLLVAGIVPYRDVWRLFSVFLKDYDLQVHVSRKQLSELINKYPSYRLMSRHPTVREFTDFILLRDDHFEKLKELFEATQK